MSCKTHIVKAIARQLGQKVKNLKAARRPKWSDYKGQPKPPVEIRG